MSAFEEQRRMGLSGGRHVVLYRKTVDYDDFSKLAVLEGEEVLLEYGGDLMNQITLQASAHLFESTHVLFAETRSERDENDLLQPVSTRIHAVDMTKLMIVEDVIEDAIGPEEGCLGLDVDPSGRFVLLPYLDEDPDFPLLKIFDGKERVLREFNTDALVDCLMQDVRWKDGDRAIAFFNPHAEGNMTASIDWDAGRVTLAEGAP